MICVCARKLLILQPQSNSTNYPSNSVTLLRSSNRNKHVNNYNQSSSSIFAAGSTPDLTRHRRLVGNSSGAMTLNAHGNQHLFSIDSSRQHGGSDNLIASFDRDNVPHYVTLRFVITIEINNGKHTKQIVFLTKLAL